MQRFVSNEVERDQYARSLSGLSNEAFAEAMAWFDSNPQRDWDEDEPCDCSLQGPNGFFAVHAPGAPGCEVNADGSLREVN